MNINTSFVKNFSGLRIGTVFTFKVAPVEQGWLITNEGQLIAGKRVTNYG
ncbi:hypothetical protein BTHERMOSOX_1095 [Bathymodiolus thermophilus thioautotrophic gill symbiont]|nr:hypothetical protein BTHERMOSOX_1095 [Bathymodiolus thermophilus thioautotrophic gill symbiont]